MMPDLMTAYHEIDNGPETDPRKRIELKAKAQADFERKGLQIHTISQLLKAYSLYQLDVHYVIENGKVVIVDEHTGRPMYGRRWSDGLHQAVEAKEGVEVERETQTLATITIQNYFRLYKKLAGMTGTAETEATEFLDIYKLGVLVIPTNKPVARKDANDSVYKTRREKFNAVLKEITNFHNQGRPILVGTVSVESSEHVSRLLKKAGIIHSVLNAKFHQQEAEIVSRAGQRGAVTIATNMAGRGTDIKLGEGVAELGGLHVIGTERHESRRIDRQLRGRCARQGDAGSSHFFISLEDDLMRLFGSDRIVKVMEKVGLEEGQELEHFMLNKSIGEAQKKVEQHNFQIRKRTLEYDDVMNKQREVIYGFRDDVIKAEDVRDRLMDVMEEVVIEKVQALAPDNPDPQDWDAHPLADWINMNFPLRIPEEEIIKVAKTGEEAPSPGSAFGGLTAQQFAVCQFICKAVRQAYELKVSFEDAVALKSIERWTILNSVDRLWQEHLYGMDSLRTSIGLRGYGQRDPLIEYQAEAFKIFEELMVNIKTDICHNIFRSASSAAAFQKFLHSIPQKTNADSFSSPPSAPVQPARDPSAKDPSDVVKEATSAMEKMEKAKPKRVGPKVGRNDPCPCGSGKKYKQCCGKNG
jgi:preprotein translocase subunit SecA